MKTKNILGILLCVGVVAAGTYFVNTKGNFNKGINENVVYAASTNSNNSAFRADMSGEDNKLFEEKASEIFKKYFDASPKDDEEYIFKTSKVNKEIVNKMIEETESSIKENYESGKWTKEQYEEELKFFNEQGKPSFERLKQGVQERKHGTITALYSKKNTTTYDHAYQVTFNENTKELDDVLITTYHDKDEKNLNLSEDKLVEISKEFMKNNDYCTIQNPKLVFTTKTEQDMNYDLGRINEKYLFFEDENDASKMFEVKIDDYTGDVMGFATSDSAKYDHERFSKAQK